MFAPIHRQYIYVLRFTENRCEILDFRTYVCLALLPQQWALYAKVDFICIYTYIKKHRWFAALKKRNKTTTTITTGRKRGWRKSNRWHVKFWIANFITVSFKVTYLSLFISCFFVFLIQVTSNGDIEIAVGLPSIATCNLWSQAQFVETLANADF